ncbi:UvrD-helicase domain-containing protein [Lysobacter sp. A03]|uniref:UvrD-helicase domain-containing protein n=1 Tax=Lysobacter sp. A03 TaxID=1199154 RepID=UPI0005B70669|nr:UvrD-helicase domain-containing protein [Lysobacter sp. A03]KIQ97826.1 Exodeoxyribonuclease V beta chain [Lysobacter sp. A03]
MNETVSALPCTPDWRDLVLAPGGRSLIEASAGTGKTWTIAVLYLRLLLEQGRSPRQVVVTTFTEAAAQELRERLRGKLRWAVQLAESAEPVAGDAGPDTSWLLGRWQQDADVRASDLQALRLALAEMDAAPISTLHSLCRRILADHPFACGVAFVMGEMVASDALLDEVTGDLWRRLQQGDDSDPLVMLGRSAGNLSRDRLRTQLKVCLGQGVSVGGMPSAEINAALDPAWIPKLEGIIAGSAETFAKSAALPRVLTELLELLKDHSRLPSEESCKRLASASKLTGVRKAFENDPHLLAAGQFAEACVPAIRGLQMSFWRELAAVARGEIESRLAARHQLTFDALISTVSDALVREAAGSERPLADALHDAWPVALVDEFQDTDALQYGILDAIYCDAVGAPRGRLVMIGDPKQAIYSFRGGDIHAYQRAAASAVAGDRLTLDTNHRSSEALVDAVNQFYAVAGDQLSALDTTDIRCRPVNASKRRSSTPYTVDGEPCAKPLVIHYQSPAAPSQPERRAQALRACADQIAEMLQSRVHRITGRPVEPSDIAVLLPTASDITSLRDELRARGVPCVTSTRSSVFATDIARDLQTVLHAVAYPGELGALRAAAATRLWGASFSELQEWGDDILRWQAVAGQFRQWHLDWQRRGVLHVVEQLITHMAPRYLQTLAGERALTDLRHLGELLQARSEDDPGLEELLGWLAECRDGDGDSGDDAVEAAQLRIESDSARVRLMTLHASKGLEFPIVFLPLMWNHGEKPGGDMHVLTDPRTGASRVERSPEAAAAKAQELQDERFRVLYVALTRAIYACHVFALDVERPANAKAKSPLQGTKRSALDVMLARLPAPLGSTELEAQTTRIDWSQGWLPTERQHYVPDAGTTGRQRNARPMPALPVGPLPGKHSFTTLTHGEQRDAVNPEAAAGDETEGSVAGSSAAVPESVPAVPHPELLAVADVRGTDFGNAVHAVFEFRKIGEPITAQLPLVERYLDDSGVRRKDPAQAPLAETLARRLQGALEAPLGLQGNPDMSLADLPEADLRAEMGFHFALDGVSMADLREACAAHGEPQLVPTSQRVLSGLMNGKIDLTFHCNERFYVLDYKGNYLGDTVESYMGSALLEQMDRSRYRFQALLYTVAVDRYLRQRLGAGYDRSRHLGECVYLFVRAAGLAPDAGIWRHRFPDALLDAVGSVLGEIRTGVAA